MIPRILEPGTVWLVGAGPGDPDLLTRKAWQLLQQADIVFHDALIGDDLLALIPGNVECVGVGKRSGRHSVPQDAINALLLDAARAGKRVVRLKGGDPSIFGRAAEELESLSAGDIPTYICPGVTTASAAAANAGGSLTLRGVARKLVLVTAHARAGETLDLDWSALADPKATLAVYMGRSAAGEISRELIAHGLPRETPVLIATNVSRPDERLVRGELGALNFLVQTISDDAPTLILIGEAAASRTSGVDRREAALC